MSDTAQQSTDGAAPPPSVNGQGDVETQARALGWRPKEDWRGSDGRWVDADTFMQRSQNWLPMVHQRNQQMARDLAAAQGQIGELRDIMAQQLERQKRAETIGYKRAMRELEQRKAEAISNADAPQVAQIDQEIRDMGPDPTQQPAARTQREAAPAPTQQADPTVVSWVQDNPWVTADPAAWDLAVSTLNRVQAAMPAAPLQEQLGEVRRRISRFFVDDQAGEEPAAAPPPRNRREAPAAVSRSGSAGSARVAPRTFDAMPADVKAQYAKELRALDGKGKPLTREEFAEYYFEQFPEETA